MVSRTVRGRRRKGNGGRGRRGSIAGGDGTGLMGGLERIVVDDDDEAGGDVRLRAATWMWQVVA